MIEPETQQEQDDINLEDQDSFKEEALSALQSIGLPEDEAEGQFEDMFGY